MLCLPATPTRPQDAEATGEQPEQEAGEMRHQCHARRTGQQRDDDREQREQHELGAPAQSEHVEHRTRHRVGGDEIAQEGEDRTARAEHATAGQQRDLGEPRERAGRDENA